MNKTVSIALAGFSFTIEEHAYTKLHDYLQALRNSLEPSEADEVMHDIEIRMVEIFKENLGKREVINNLDVEEVINRIGKPEEIEEQEETYYSDTHSKQKSTEKKQLFRDPERQKIAGVCAGLSHYIGLDMTLMRVLWVLFFLVMFPFYGSPMIVVLLYVILWIVLPKAQTATDFLKMKGEPLNFDNLKKESTKIVDFANDSTKKVGEFYNQNKPIIHKTGDNVGNIFRYIFGGLFAFLAIGSIVGVFSILSFSTENWNVMGNVGFFLKGTTYFKWVPMTFVLLSTLIPALLFTYLAIKLLSPKTKLNYVGYVFGGLILVWIGLLISIGYAAVKQGTMYNGTKNEKENIAINTNSDSIIIAKKNVEISEDFKSYWSGVFSDGKTVFKKDNIDVDIIRKDSVKPYLIIKERAKGYNQPLKLKVPVRIVNNKIEFPNYINYPFEYRMRNYRVDYELVVPNSTKIINDDERYIDIDDDKYDDEYDNDDDVNTNLKININGDKIEINSNEEDSIIINGKKVSEKEADKILKKKDIDLDDIKNFDLNIEDGENKIQIKTGK